MIELVTNIQSTSMVLCLTFLLSVKYSSFLEDGGANIVFPIKVIEVIGVVGSGITFLISTLIVIWL